MIDRTKTALSSPWTEAMLTLFGWQEKVLDSQYRFGQRMIRTMLGLERAGPGAATSEPGPKVTCPERTDLVTPMATIESPVKEAAHADASYPSSKEIKDRVAIVTGAASGIGAAVARQLAQRGARAVFLVDRSKAANELAKSINDTVRQSVAQVRIGDTADEAFRVRVFDEAIAEHGVPSICVPAAGVTRDRLSVKVDKTTGRSDICSLADFRLVIEVNLIAPVYWALEMVARIAEDRWRRGKARWEPEEGIQGTVVFIGSVSSQGNKGQLSYAVSKAGLEGAAATLMKEAIFHGVRCGVIHPGFTDTPMVRAMGEEQIAKHVLPYTQLRRLIRPDEIADAICFMISNSAVSGELWADAGWHPSA
jgi:NAD(P)-dependent dehydrogenase (short-subunit alcohol dehydrogenase family)